MRLLPRTVCPWSDAKTLFFSEAAEGSSNNKFLEIYNPTDADIELSGYAFPSVANGADKAGEHDYWNAFDANAKVKAKGVYIICHPDADAAIKAKCDQEHKYLSNGDDGYCLAKGTEADHDLIDCAIPLNPALTATAPTPMPQPSADLHVLHGVARAQHLCALTCVQVLDTFTATLVTGLSSAVRQTPRRTTRSSARRAWSRGIVATG